MNVLFLTKYDVCYGGIAAVLGGLSAALAKEGVNVLVYSNDDSAAAGKLPCGTPCVQGPLPRPGALGGGKAVKHIAEVCKTHKIDLVQTHGLYRPGYAARLLKKRFGIPYIPTSHGDMVGSTRMQRPKVRKRCAEILRDADAIVMPTQPLADEVESLLPNSGVVVISDGIDVAEWDEHRDAATKRGYIVGLGRLHEQKGFDTLLAAVGKLAAKGRRAPLVIAGTGPREDSLRQQAGELGLTIHSTIDELLAAGEGLCLAGYIEEGRPKFDLITQAEIFAFPSAYGEGFGVVMLETFAAGTAMLASDLPTLYWLVEPESNCDVAAPGDTDAWASALERLWTDNARRQRYVDTALADVQTFDWAALARDYLPVYRQAAGG